MRQDSLHVDAPAGLGVASAALQCSALAALIYSSLPLWLSLISAGGLLLRWLCCAFPETLAETLAGALAGTQPGTQPAPRNRSRNRRPGGIAACRLDEDGLSLELADGRYVPVTLERAYLSTAIQVLQFCDNRGGRQKQTHYLPGVSITQSDKHAAQRRAVRLLALTGGVLRAEHRVIGSG